MRRSAVVFWSVVALAAAPAAAFEVICIAAPQAAGDAPAGVEEAPCSAVAIHVGESTDPVPGEHRIALKAQQLAEALNIHEAGFFTLTVDRAETVLFERGTGTSLQIFRSPQAWLASRCEAGGAQVSDASTESRFATIEFPEGGGSCDFFFSTTEETASLPTPSPQVVAVPEPSTLGLLGLGLLALVWSRRG